MTLSGLSTRNCARVNPTVAALMRRGFDSGLANRLREIGITLAKLQQLDDNSLVGLDLTYENILAIRKDGRPPIPFGTLVDVLWANRSGCCVCRSYDRAIILHHIVPWAESHNHGSENLAVLCTEHHARAHRIGRLEQNLSAAQIRAFKKKWEDEVRDLDTRALLDATRVDGHHWWWFNHVRILEMARSLDVNLTLAPNFHFMTSKGWVDQQGQITRRQMDEPYMYVGGDGILLYEYMREVVEAVLARTTIFNMSDDLDPGFIGRVIRTGDLILIQGKHTFKRLDRVRLKGAGQACQVTRCANGVQLSFTIDLWEAVATSAWAAWLTGTKLAASIVRVGSIENDGQRLQLRCTGLAIGSALQGLSTRSYCSGSWDMGRNNAADECVTDLDFDD